MRTTIDLPDELIAEAMRITGFKSKRDTVVQSLREFIRRHRVEELKEMFGKVELDIDIPKSRRRPAKKK